MTTTLRLKTNLNCGSCVAAVKPLLDGDPAVDRWEVDTSVPEKVLTVTGEDVTREAVAAAVARAGFRVLGDAPPRRPAGPNGRDRDAGPPDAQLVSLALSSSSAAETTPASGTVPARSGLATYYPLLLLVAFLVGVTAVVEIQAGGFAWDRAMRTFMGAFFVAFAFFKLLDLRGFADAYRMYDVVARRVPAWGYLYPFLELGLGIGYLLDLWPVATNLATVIVMSVSAVGVIQSVLAGRTIRCACLGTVFNLPMSTVTIAEDGTMIVMAAVMLVRLGLGTH